ncbi:MAG: sulfur carrier protein ThiS [Planctomycetaceae bacterium]
MPTIQLNGEAREVPDEWTVADLLEDLGINNRYCAVEQNQYVVPREEHHERFLQEGDNIEIVTLVGGG